MFSPNVRVREESVTGFQKDRALEEVFRRMPDSAAMRTQRRHERRKTQTAIRNWMDRNDQDGVGGNWPTIDSRAVPDWHRRLSMGWDRPSNLRQVSEARSIASDPADLISNVGGAFMPSRLMRSRMQNLKAEYKDHTDADGDDELLTNDEDEDDFITNAGHSRRGGKAATSEAEDYFTTPMGPRSAKLASSHSSSGKGGPSTPKQPAQRRGLHSRTMSTNTILYNPEDEHPDQSSSVSPPKTPAFSRRISISAPNASGEASAQAILQRSSPRRSIYNPNSKPRPIMPARGVTDAAGGVSRTALLSIDPRNRNRIVRRLSSVDLSLMSDSNMPFGGDPNVGMAGSFQTQMAMAMMKDNRLRGTGGIDAADRDRMGRLVLARMKTLEESFADVIKEMRDLKNSSTAPTTRRNSSGEELKFASSMEMTGHDRPKTRSKGSTTPKRNTGKRPVSRRSMKESKVGIELPQDNTKDKGKGKEVAYPSTDEAAEAFAKRGSSM